GVLSAQHVLRDHQLADREPAVADDVSRYPLYGSEHAVADDHDAIVAAVDVLLHDELASAMSRLREHLQSGDEFALVGDVRGYTRARGSLRGFEDDWISDLLRVLEREMVVAAVERAPLRDRAACSFEEDAGCLLVSCDRRRDDTGERPAGCAERQLMSRPVGDNKARLRKAPTVKAASESLAFDDVPVHCVGANWGDVVNVIVRVGR